jgi:hypothetical protein
MKLPTTFYKSPGSFKVPGTRDSYRYIGVKTQEELDHHMANGWFESRDAAIAARKAPVASPATSNTSYAPSQPTVEEVAPPTRAELEQKAQELGISFTERTTDAKLSKAILKAMGA